jgi:hypothetical protein
MWSGSGFLASVLSFFHQGVENTPFHWILRVLELFRPQRFHYSYGNHGHNAT